MKKQKIAILWMAALSLVTLQSCRQDVIDSGRFGEIGNKMNWTLYDDGTLVIEGKGAMGDRPSGNTPWVHYNEIIRAVVIKDGVTSIGEYAFEGCTSLSSITFPESVTSIGERAFEGCESLSSIILPKYLTSIGEGAFAECTSLASLTFPESLTSIGMSAFAKCTSLASLTFPESLTSISTVAFAGCTSLIYIIIKAPTPPSIFLDSFRNVNQSIPVYVSASSVENYRNSAWGQVFSNFQPM